MSGASIPPMINRDNCLCTWKLTVDPLWDNHWSTPPPWINRGNHLFTWKWGLTVDPLWGNCQSLPPGSTEVITLFTRKWKLTVDPLWGDRQSPPHDQQKTCSCILIKLSGTVPNFIFFNILISFNLKLVLEVKLTRIRDIIRFKGKQWKCRF